MNINNFIPILLEQRRGIVATSGNQQTRPVQVLRPSWRDMINNYPNSSVDVNTLYTDIGNGLLGMLKQNSAWENTCAFRMSRGLNYSGFKLPNNNSNYRAKGTIGGVHKGDDKLNYWYRVRELAPYLSDHLGKPEIDIKLDKIEMPANLRKNNNLTQAEWTQVWNSKKKVSQTDWTQIHNAKGIITFDVSGWDGASGHFTLWDGNHLIYPGGAEHDDPKSSKYYFHMLYPVKNKKNELDFVQTNRIRLWELK
ncbi:T6SS effector amidase Tae4 family protein [Chryseobacterium sp. c4a]|uniref:T6SS effector amidase Tae4 family protein n=1 Tax=Chryseobacterium sp. c4a TaxID=1573582 RepID=UPI00135B8CB2|nr:T6SS effector amidase Tae4 family protein [Chryseobacterium sp. c4a]